MDETLPLVALRFEGFNERGWILFQSEIDFKNGELFELLNCFASRWCGTEGEWWIQPPVPLSAEGILRRIDAGHWDVMLEKRYHYLQSGKTLGAVQAWILQERTPEHVSSPLDTH